MKKLIPLIFIVGCLQCSAETNRAPFSAFVLPKIKLRPLESQLATANPEQLRDTRTNSLWEISHSSSSGDNLSGSKTDAPALVAEFRFEPSMSVLERQVYGKLERGGYLTRPQPSSEMPVLRWLASTFEPAEIRIGKTSVSCSLVTAIKNRNPLCLVNPLFLNALW
jgi:hypothetical protein